MVGTTLLADQTNIKILTLRHKRQTCNFAIYLQNTKHTKKYEGESQIFQGSSNNMNGGFTKYMRS